MRKWYLIEDCTTSRAAVYHTELRSADKAGAVAEGIEIWSGLTRKDREDREAVFVISAEADEHGDPGFDSAEDWTDIWEEIRKEAEE